MPPFQSIPTDKLPPKPKTAAQKKAAKAKATKEKTGAEATPLGATGGPEAAAAVAQQTGAGVMDDGGSDSQKPSLVQAAGNRFD